MVPDNLRCSASLCANPRRTSAFKLGQGGALTGDPLRAYATLLKNFQQLTKAEGTRFELATGCPAPHFQCGR